MLLILGNSNINLLAYANNIALLRNTEKEVKLLYGKLLAMTEIIGLNVNKQKNEIYSDKSSR